MMSVRARADTAPRPAFEDATTRVASAADERGLSKRGGRSGHEIDELRLACAIDAADTRPEAWGSQQLWRALMPPGSRSAKRGSVGGYRGRECEGNAFLFDNGWIHAPSSLSIEGPICMCRNGTLSGLHLSVLEQSLGY